MFRGDHVGFDTLNYMSPSRIQYRGGNLDFELTTDYIVSNFGNATEFIDIILNRIVFNFNLTPRIIIYTYSIISIGALFIALIKFKVNVSIGLLMYVLLGFYYNSFNTARQLAAVSVFLFALYYIVQEKKSTNEISNFFKFILYVLIASMIHASAIFYVILYPTRFIKLKRNFVNWTIIIVTFICVLMSFNIMNLVYGLFNFEYVTRYLGLYDDGSRSLMGRIYDVLCFVFYIYIFIYRTNIKDTNHSDIIYGLALILNAIFSQTSGIISRIIFYITIFICIYVPYSLLKNSKSLKNYRRINVITYGNKFYLFLTFIVLSSYNIGTMGHSLSSGYYLIF